MKILNWLRLTDPHDGQLSLTNLALLVVLVKIGAAPEVTLVDAGALFVALLSYQGKKLINRDNKSATEELAITYASNHDAIVERIEELASKVNAQQVALGIKELKR